MKQSYQAIFNPGPIGRLIAKNRLVLPVIVQNYADDAGRATSHTSNASHVAASERLSWRPVSCGRLASVGHEVTVIEAEGSPHETRKLPADMIVMCLGAKSVNEFARTSAAPNLRSRVIGDAVRPRKVTEAVAEGALAILDLLGVKLSPAICQELHSEVLFERATP